MKFGHATGIKKERKGSQDWYKAIEMGNIRRIEEQWAAKSQSSQQHEGQE